MLTMTRVYVKRIDCPEHPGKHKVILHCEPDPFAGIWECDVTGEGISDAHDHYEAFENDKAELLVEEIEVDTMRNGEHDTYPARIYVCGGQEGCGITLDGNPDVDAAESRADMEYDEWKDNQ